MLLKVLNRLPKVKFGKWARLEGIRREIQKAVEVDAVEFAKLVLSYISTAFPFIQASSLYWEDALVIYTEHVNKNTPKRIPMFTTSNGKDDEVPWSYIGRDFYFLVHTLARGYGWTVQYICNLNVDDALALIQETFASNQLDKEFMYGLSELAYPYSSTTKTSKFRPMERPVWMLPKVKEIKRVKILKQLIPVGQGIDDSGMETILKKREDKKT